MEQKSNPLSRSFLLINILLLPVFLLCSCSTKTAACINAEKELVQAYQVSKSTSDAMEIAVKNPIFSSKDLGFEFGKNSTAFFLKVKFLPIYCKGSALQVVMDKEPGLQEEIARTKKLRSLMGIGYNNNEW